MVKPNFKFCFALLPTLFFLGSSFTVFGQSETSEKKEVKESTIQALMAYYHQDGNHSAVTGGTGTEFLEVYSTSINYYHTVDTNKTYSVHVGADIISSASTDRIDYEMSSASREDLRSSVGLGYSQTLQGNDVTLGGQLMFSLESDYASIGTEIYIAKVAKNQLSDWSFYFSAFFDDLRWGRLQPPYIVEAIGLIYPSELRYKEWFDIHNRYSYNFSFSYSRDLNKRMNLSFYPLFTYQQGLLSTPFHRVYFENQLEAKVENLPREKYASALGIQWNAFVTKRIILRTFYQAYLDNFGMTSQTAKLDVPIKLSPKFTLMPFIRYTHQVGTRYFKPYMEHNISDTYYTSDFDLSSFWSNSIGITTLITRRTEKSARWQIQRWSLRYAYYQRSDGLKSHMLSVFLDLGKKVQLPKMY